MLHFQKGGKMEEKAVYDEGELVEVEITENMWVEARVISDQEWRVVVKLLVPVIWVKEEVFTTDFFFFKWKKKKKKITGKLVRKMTFSKIKVRTKRKEEK